LQEIIKETEESFHKGDERHQGKQRWLKLGPYCGSEKRISEIEKNISREGCVRSRRTLRPGSEQGTESASMITFEILTKSMDKT